MIKQKNTAFLLFLVHRLFDMNISILTHKMEIRTLSDLLHQYGLQVSS